MLLGLLLRICIGILSLAILEKFIYHRFLSVKILFQFCAICKGIGSVILLIWGLHNLEFGSWRCQRKLTWSCMLHQGSCTWCNQLPLNFMSYTALKRATVLILSQLKSMGPYGVVKWFHILSLRKSISMISSVLVEGTMLKCV